MDQQDDEFGKMIERLAGLGTKDREAILDRMGPDHRAQIEAALREHAEEQREEEERQKRIDRQFLGYSPWLATAIENSEKNPNDALTETCAKAVWDIHSTKVSSGMSVTRSGWLGVADRINDWLSLAGKNTA